MERKVRDNQSSYQLIMPLELKKRLKVHCVTTGVTINDHINALIENALNQKSK